MALVPCIKCGIKRNDFEMSSCRHTSKGEIIGLMCSDCAHAIVVSLDLNEFSYEITRTIARNLTAWDTSKDKSIGMLPEVYLANKGLYKKLTGEEYSFSKACKKFDIDHAWDVTLN